MFHSVAPTFFTRLAKIGLLAVPLLTGLPALAADPVLMRGPGVAVTASDLRADALRIPPEQRAQTLAQPQSVGQLVSNLYARRALAEKAQADGLANDPVVQAALRLARDRVLSDALLARVEKAATPEDAALERLARNIYNAEPARFKAGEQVRVRHILVSGADDAARAKAEKVLADLKAGADFAERAKAESADKSSAARGGDLGYFERGRMVPPFETAAFGLREPGELSSLVQTQFGFHILKYEGRKPEGIRPFEEVRLSLMNDTRQKLQHDARIALVDQLRSGATLDQAAVEAFAAQPQPTP